MNVTIDASIVGLTHKVPLRFKLTLVVGKVDALFMTNPPATLKVVAPEIGVKVAPELLVSVPLLVIVARLLAVMVPLFVRSYVEKVVSRGAAIVFPVLFVRFPFTVSVVKDETSSVPPFTKCPFIVHVVREEKSSTLLFVKVPIKKPVEFMINVPVPTVIVPLFVRL